MGLRPSYDGFAEMGGGGEAGKVYNFVAPLKLEVRLST